MLARHKSPCDLSLMRPVHSGFRLCLTLTPPWGQLGSGHRWLSVTRMPLSWEQNKVSWVGPQSLLVCEAVMRVACCCDGLGKPAKGSTPPGVLEFILGNFFKLGYQEVSASA